MSQNFDPDVLMNTSIEQPLSTQVIQPDGGEYEATIDSVNLRNGTGKNGEPYYMLNVGWELHSEEAKQKTGREKVVARQSLFLDVDEDSGRLETEEGKNVDLGRLFDTLGLNDQDKSIKMLEGRPAKVLVSVDEGNDGVPRANVRKVAAIG